MYMYSYIHVEIPITDRAESRYYNKYVQKGYNIYNASASKASCRCLFPVCFSRAQFLDAKSQLNQSDQSL